MNTYVTIKIEHPDNESPNGVIEYAIKAAIKEIDFAAEQGWKITVEQGTEQ